MSQNNVLENVPSCGTRPCSLKISSGIRPCARTLSIILTPYTSLLEKLKSASINRIARSFVTRVHPRTFSSITERPRDHRSIATPCRRAIATFSACSCEIVGEREPAM